MVNREAFDTVVADLEAGNQLTLAHIGSVFGEDFWIMIVECLLDSQDAARAIQGAINRLRGGGSENIGYMDAVDAQEE
jgi:hypothetical protein